MARLVIHVDLDVDPTLEDPEEVAEELLIVQYCGVEPYVRFASWDA